MSKTWPRRRSVTPSGRAAGRRAVRRCHRGSISGAGDVPALRAGTGLGNRKLRLPDERDKLFDVGICALCDVLHARLCHFEFRSRLIELSRSRRPIENPGRDACHRAGIARAQVVGHGSLKLTLLRNRRDGSHGTLGGCPLLAGFTQSVLTIHDRANKSIELCLVHGILQRASLRENATGTAATRHRFSMRWLGNAARHGEARSLGSRRARLIANSPRLFPMSFSSLSVGCEPL